MLVVRDLVKHHPCGDGPPIRAVDGVSLSIAAGEFVAVYGPSGSGKSTLINLIAGVESPDSGTVTVDGRDVHRMSDRETADFRLNELGIVGRPSDLMLGARTHENASLKLWRTDPRHAREMVQPWLERMGLERRANHETRKLSMGERQRVALIQALSTMPKLVLADEPTASLDSDRTRDVLIQLRGLCKENEMALLLATHDPQAAEYADRVLVLRDGHLLDAPPANPPTCSEPSSQV